MENNLWNSDQDLDRKSLDKGLKDQLMKARKLALEGLQQGPHSVELVGCINGVDYLNDSKSTFLDASLRTLSTLDRPVVWVIGTQLTLPEQDWFKDIVNKHVKAVVLYGQNGARAIDRARGIFRFPYHMEDLRTATFLAREVAEQGDVVLFSPACASSPDFANYEERGVAFKRAVKDL
jgi:UDP-N-acetylmuramoylalanine--D-glutamate ligase